MAVNAFSLASPIGRLGGGKSYESLSAAPSTQVLPALSLAAPSSDGFPATSGTVTRVRSPSASGGGVPTSVGATMGSGARLESSLSTEQPKSAVMRATLRIPNATFAPRGCRGAPRPRRETWASWGQVARLSTPAAGLNRRRLGASCQERVRRSRTLRRRVCDGSMDGRSLSVRRAGRRTDFAAHEPREKHDQKF